MKKLQQFGGFAAIIQGIGLFIILIIFAGIMPGYGLKGMEDYADAGKVLPVMVSHGEWFKMVAYGCGLLADSLFLITIIAAYYRLRRSAPNLMRAAFGIALIGMVFYQFTNIINATYMQEIIKQFAVGNTASASAQFVVANGLADAGLKGGGLWMGIWALLTGYTIYQSRVLGRVSGALLMIAGILNVGNLFVFIIPALPITGIAFLWFGYSMWRGAEKHSEEAEMNIAPQRA